MPYLPSAIAMIELPGIAPTRFAALRQLLKTPPQSAVDVAYTPDNGIARLRAYLTHGLLSVPEILLAWNRRAGLTLNDHVCQDMLQYEYCQHLWRHRGDGILSDIQKRSEKINYQRAIPADIRMAATGLEPIDLAIRQLYGTGLLHRQQLYWIAAYAIHMRKVDWRAGMRWMHGHSLDGNLATICLGWQKIAGTAGQTLTVFNAAAMSDGAYKAEGASSTSGSEIDRPIQELFALAEKPEQLPAEALRPLPQREPKLIQHPPLAAISLCGQIPSLAQEDVYLVHPWNLAPPLPKIGPIIGVLHLPFHIRFPWDEQRWHFVLERMTRICDAIWFGDLLNCNHWLREARSVCSQVTLYPGYREALNLAGVTCIDAPDALPDPGHPCASFEMYLQAIRRKRPDLFETPLRGQIARLHQQGKAIAPYPDS